MKQILLPISIIITMIIGISSSTTAQTIIFENDGASNEFTPSDWTISGGGFANPDQVNITNGGTGSLALANADSYTDITVEINFSQSGTISYDLALKEGGSEAASELGNISDASGAVNTSIVSFNNAAGIALDAIEISNPNMTIGVTYIKITGTLDPNSSLDAQYQNQFQIGAFNKTVFIDSEVKGEVEIYNLKGQKELSTSISNGKTILNLSNLIGIHIVVLRNKAGEILRREKVVLI